MKSKSMIGLLVTVSVVRAFSQTPWNLEPSAWSENTARAILTASPWAKRVRPQSLNGAGMGTPALTIRWESALPIVLAHQRVEGTPLLPERPAYRAVAVVNLAEHWTPNSELKFTAFLKPSGKPSIASQECRRIPQRDGTEVLLFLFPAAIDVGEPRRFRLPFGMTSNAWEVEFSADLGVIRVKQVFPLEDMIYLGKLEL
jgi:hypothetical protein